MRYISPLDPACHIWMPWSPGGIYTELTPACEFNHGACTYRAAAVRSGPQCGEAPTQVRDAHICASAHVLAVAGGIWGDFACVASGGRFRHHSYY